MEFSEHVSLRTKTTMRIGGTARWYAELATREDVEEAVRFARERNVSLIVLGGGSNTIFADGDIAALVVRIAADGVRTDGSTVSVEAGKPLASLIVELAERNLDLSALTGIPGTVGGALFGNAGQGPKGMWIDAFVVSATAYIDGAWTTLDRKQCAFRYRESGFKDLTLRQRSGQASNPPPIIWSAELRVPERPKTEVLAEVERLLGQRIVTQPHRQTAGSCFKAVGSTPAWQLIDAAGLRGLAIGGVQVSEKHANFLLNVGSGTFEDARRIVETVRAKVPEPLEVEMRFVESDGSCAF